MTGPRLWLASAIVAAGGVVPGPWLPSWAARGRDVLRDDGRNAADHDRMERGYYERLLQPAQQSSSAPANDFGPLTVSVADVREYVLRPNLATTLRGATWTTNGLGQRDRPVAAVHPTFRIALVGDSIGSGWGVADGAGFEPTWERWLQAQTDATVEVCNLAVPGHAPGQRWDHFGRVGWTLAPDLVIFQGTGADLAWDERKLRSLVPLGLGWDAPAYRDALDAAGLRPGATAEQTRAALRPRRDAVLLGVYRAVVADCHAHGVPALWLLLPRVGKPVSPADRVQLLGLARAAGFAAVIDLSDSFDDLSSTELAIAPDDFHPNGRGHERIASRLAAAWSKHGWRPFGTSTPGDQPR